MTDIHCLLEKRNTSTTSGSSSCLAGGRNLYILYNTFSSKYVRDRRRGQNTLKLKFTNASDAGDFECQVSTNPKISQVFELTVVGECRHNMTLCNKQYRSLDSIFLRLGVSPNDTFLAITIKIIYFSSICFCGGPARKARDGGVSRAAQMLH